MAGVRRRGKSAGCGRLAPLIAARPCQCRGRYETPLPGLDIKRAIRPIMEISTGHTCTGGKAVHCSPAGRVQDVNGRADLTSIVGLPGWDFLRKRLQWRKRHHRDTQPQRPPCPACDCPLHHASQDLVAVSSARISRWLPIMTILPARQTADCPVPRHACAQSHGRPACSPARVSRCIQASALIFFHSGAGRTWPLCRQPNLRPRKLPEAEGARFPTSPAIPAAGHESLPRCREGLCGPILRS